MKRKTMNLIERAGAFVLAAIITLGMIQMSGLTMEAQAEEAVNLASGIIPTAAWTDGSEMEDALDGEVDSNSAERATEGEKGGQSFYRYGQPKDPSVYKTSYAQFDLKKTYDIDSVKLWRYFDDAREYTPTLIAVSDAEGEWNAENAEVIYNSDQNDIYGFGPGTEEGYAETVDGKEFICAEPVTGRYVRIYSYGSNVNNGNHIVEFEVYGSIHTQVPGKVSVIFDKEGEQYTAVPEEGSASPMDPGQNYTFRIQPKTGYYVNKVTVNGNVLESENGIYTINEVQEDQTVAVEVLPYPDAENLALKKSVEVRKTADDSTTAVSSDRPEKMAVDGIIPKGTSDPNYCDFGENKAGESSYLQIDLKGNYELCDINLWRYWNDNRVYNGSVIAVSESQDGFKNADTRQIIYNSDADNIHGVGVGTDETYVETEEGFKISLKEKFPDQIIKGRYVRIYMCGFDKGKDPIYGKGNTNHVVECQVMGYNLGEKPYQAKAFDNTGN